MRNGTSKNMKSSVTGICQACMVESNTNLYHGSLTVDSTDISKSKGLGLKVELCIDCYDKMVIAEQIEYWKMHIEEEKNRSP